MMIPLPACISEEVQSVFCLVFCLFLVVTACDSGGGMDDDPPEEPPPTTDSVTVSAEATDTDGSRIDTAKIMFDGTRIGTGFAEQTFAEDAQRSIDVKADADGLIAADTSVGLGSDHDLSLSLRKQLPEEVTLSFSNTAANADSSAAGTWTWKGEEIASGIVSGSHTVSGSEEAGTLCFQEGKFFLQACAELTPDQNRSVELEIQRKQVTVSVTPVDSNKAVRTEATTTIYEPFRSDSTALDGNASAELPKRSGDRMLVSDWITEEPNSSKLDRWRSDTIHVSAGEDADREIALNQLIPACSDGIDNDGDDAVDRAEGPACTDLDGNYDPADDNEILKRFSRATGRLFDDSVSVSKKVGERSAEIASASNPFPWSVTVAKGEIKHRMEVQRSDSITNQSHATHLKTGASNDNLTVAKTSEVTADADTANGFVLIRVHGIDRSFFADGPHYAVYGWHGCKVRGNCGSIEGTGKFYYFAELENSRGHSWSYIFEPEDVPDNKQQPPQLKAGTATFESNECRQVSKTDTVCRIPAGEIQ